MTSPTRRIRLHAETTEDGRGLARLRDDLQRAAKGVDSLGDSMSGAELDAKGLRKEAHGLGDEFERAGRRGSKAMSGLLDFGGTGIRPRNAAIGAIVGAVALAAPTIGAMVAGAVTGAVGLGGIAGGIAAAAKSPAVKLAASNFASNVGAAFSQYGDQFVEPLVNAFQILEQGFHDLNLERAFEKTAAYVDDIARGLAGFGRNMMPGIERTLDVAGPALEILGRELPRLGKAFGDMFANMAAGKGTLQGLLFLIGTVKFTFEALGATVRWLSDRFYDWMVFLKNFTGVMEDIPGPFQDKWAKANDVVEGFIANANTAGQAMNYIGRESVITAGSVKATSDAINILNQALYDQHSAQLALSDATLAYEGGLIRLRESVKENGTELDRTTAKGNANRVMINGLIGDLRAEYEAALVAAGGNEEKQERARRAYNKQVADLQRVLQNLGFEKREIEKIIAAYKNIPTRIYTKIIQDYETRGVPAGEHSGPRSAENRQHGGPVFPGVAYRINERGRETVTFPAAGTVHPANLTPMTGGGGSPVSVMISGAPLVQQAVDMVLRELDRRGIRLRAA